MDVTVPDGATGTQIVKMYLGGEEGNIVESTMHVDQCMTVQAIPSITPWGAVALALLMLAGAVWVGRNKRRKA